MRKLNKTEFQFYKDADNRLYMEIVVTKNNLHILKEMFGIGEHISVDNEKLSDYIPQNEDEVYAITKEMSDEEYHNFMGHVGAYTCPFCGGKLRWESDFMTSEVHGLEHGYYKVTDEEGIKYLKEKHDEYIRSGILSHCKDIEQANTEVVCNGTYDYVYLQDDNGDYWEIDDPVIGIYECGNCGKRYEIQDAYSHDSDDEIDNYYE